MDAARARARGESQAQPGHTSPYLISHDEQVLLMGEVQHLLDTLLTLHLTYIRTKTVRLVPGGSGPEFPAYLWGSQG